MYTGTQGIGGATQGTRGATQGTRKTARGISGITQGTRGTLETMPVAEVEIRHQLRTQGKRMGGYAGGNWGYWGDKRP